MDYRRRLHSTERLLLSLVLFASFFQGLGTAPLFDKDEGAFCEATREMVASGNYLMTYLNGEPRYDKPILIYWFQALSTLIFGMNEFALRLPSAIAAGLWAWLTFRFVREFLGTDIAYLTVLIMATTLQVTVIAKAAIADSLLNLFIAGAMFDLYRFFAHGRKPALYRAAALIAMGTLTKGPMAVIIPVAVTLVFCLIQGQGRRWLRNLADPVAWGVFLAIAAPWFVAAYADQGQPLLDAYFKHTVGRAQGAMEGHRGPFFYYVPVVLIGLLPHTALLVKGCSGLRKRLRDPMMQYLGLWFVFVFLFMSSLATKLPHYVIYGYTPLFILMALQVDRLHRGAIAASPLIALLALLMALAVALPFLADRVPDPFVAHVMREAAAYFGWGYYAPLAVLTVMAGVAGAVYANNHRRSLALLGIVCIAAVNLALLPAVAEIRQRPIREAALLAKARDLDVIVWGLDDMPSFIFYRESLVRTGIPRKGDVVLTKRTMLDYLDAHEVLYEKYGVVLARVGAEPAGGS